jgi:hypothetical protein
MPSRYPYVAALFVSMLLLLGACPSSDDDDDDDDDNTIEAPAACSNPSLSNVSFTFSIHYDGEDYPQNELLTLMSDVWGTDNFAFPFAPAVITELGPDPESNRLAITLTDGTPVKEGEDPPEDPNTVRIVYELPLGYELPVELNQEIGSVVGLDTSLGSLIAAFVFYEEVETKDGPGIELLFLAEPSDLGSFWEPGPFHPMLRDFSMRDRACPNLNALQCASTYNLSMEVATQDITDDDGNVTEPGTSFEVWPTEHVDFTFDGVEMRFVNVWSYTYREINPDCVGPYDYSAQRKSFFVTRAAAAPAD